MDQRTALVRWAAFLSGAACVTLISLAPLHGGEPTGSKVNIRDIRDGKAVIVGLLGQPIGKFVKLRGRWAKRYQGSDLQLDVTHVDGKQLPAPVDFDKFFVHAVDKHDRAVAPLKDDKWEMEAYESCGFFRIEPDEFQKSLGRYPNSYDQQPYVAGACFATRAPSIAINSTL